MAEVYVVQSKVRALAKKKGFRFSGEAVDALSKLVETTVAAAGARAKANKRQPIRRRTSRLSFQTIATRTAPCDARGRFAFPCSFSAGLLRRNGRCKIGTFRERPTGAPGACLDSPWEEGYHSALTGRPFFWRSRCLI